MTSPVGVIGLAYSGYDLQRADLNVMFAISEGLDTLPVVRGVDQLIPFRTGNLAQVRTGDRRSVVATGWVAGAAPAPEASYRAYLDGLKKVLDPTRLPDILVATLTDGTTRWINAVPRNMLGGEMVGYEMRPLSIEWEALDPYWYGSYGYMTLDAGHDLDEGDFLDGGAELIVAGSGDVLLDTGGSASVERVRIRFVGPSTGPIGVETVGAVPVGFQIARTLSAFECVEVNNVTRTVETLADATIALSWPSGAPRTSIRNQMTLSAGNLHGEYIRLPPGPVTLRVTGGASQTRILFTPSYQ